MPEVLDVLVVMDAGQAPGALARLEGLGRVRQQLPPRLVVMAVAGDRLTDVLGVPGVQAVARCGEPVDVSSPSAAEQLFLAAWVESTRPKQRPGEGQPWDAPGFLPPDRPGDTTG